MAAALAGTIGYVREHAGESIYEASVTGQAREIGGVSAGQAATERILTSPLIAVQLHDSNVLLASARELRRAVNVDVSWPTFTITARGNSRGYAAVLARSWAAAINPLLATLLVEDPAEAVAKLNVPLRDRAGATLALRRERALTRQPAGAALAPNDPRVEELTRLRTTIDSPVDVVAAVSAPVVSEQAVNRRSVWQLLLWLIGGAAAGTSIALIQSALLGLRRQAALRNE